MEFHSGVPFNHALVVAAIERSLHLKPVRVKQVETRGIRGLYQTALPDEREVIVKVESPVQPDEWRLGLEVWAMEQARAAGVPVPAVLAQDLTMQPLPFRYVVMEMTPGIALNEAKLSTEDMRTALRNAGRLLARLHRVRLNGFGTLDEGRYLDTGEVMGRFARWAVPSSLRAEAALNELSNAGAIDFEEAAGAMYIVESAMHAPDDLPSRLLHGDFTAHHALVDPATGTIAGLIDFGDRMGGMPAWDLAGAWLSHIRLRGLPPNATASMVRGWEAESGARMPKEELSAACLLRLLVLARVYHDAGRVAAFEELRFHLRMLLEDAGRL